MLRMRDNAAAMFLSVAHACVQKKAGQVVKAKEAHDIVSALKELKGFMLVEGVPDKNRQKLLRNLRVRPCCYGCRCS